MAQTTATKTEKAKTTSKTKVAEVKLVKASARFIKMSPRKLRLVADMVRRKPVDLALEQLQYSSKNAAMPITKLINSAVANAVHNFNLRKEDLFVQTISVDGGPVMLRYRPRAQGRAGAIHKRSAHINVVLGERKQAKRKGSRNIFAAIRRPKSDKVEEHKHDHDREIEDGHVHADGTVHKHDHGPKTDEQKKSQKISLKRRLFNRKSGQ